MRLRIAAVAKRELNRVHNYYERRATGLGDAFLDDVTASLSLIKQYPRAWTALGGPFYRRRLTTFKYALVYRTDVDSVVVVGVGHVSRRPAFWRKMMARSVK